MRARNLKPALFKNELLGTVDPLLTILFEGLWCEADREGRLEDRPLRLRAEIFPYRGTYDIEAGLTWLQQHGFIDRYEVGGVRIIQVVKFLDHQRPHSSEAASVLPPKPARAVKQARKSGEPTLTARHTKVDRTVNVGDAPNALTPDPLLLTPDSGSPRTDSLDVGGGANAPRETFLAIRDRYPQGLHRGDHWLLAEREIYQRLDEGIPAEVLIAATDGYRAQQEAAGTIGTGKVIRPSNFFACSGPGHSGPWQGPFPVPKANGAAVLAFRSKTADEIEREAAARGAHVLR